MSKSSSSSSSSGMGCFSTLAVLFTVLFTGLKLTHNIDWSWWWVLSPVWLYGLYVVGIVVIYIVALLILDK